VILFDVDLGDPLLSHQISFQIQVVVKKKNIFHMTIDKGASTCIMSMYCWTTINSPSLATSLTILKAFNGRIFQLNGILTYFP